VNLATLKTSYAQKEAKAKEHSAYLTQQLRSKAEKLAQATRDAKANTAGQTEHGQAQEAIVLTLLFGIGRGFTELKLRYDMWREQVSLNSSNAERESFKSSMKNIDYLERKVNAYSKYPELLLKKNVLLEQIKALHKTVAEQREKIEAMKTEAEALRKTIESAGLSSGEMVELKDRLIKLEWDIKAAEKHLDKMEEDNDKKEENINKELVKVTSDIGDVMEVFNAKDEKELHSVFESTEKPVLGEGENPVALMRENAEAIAARAVDVSMGTGGASAEIVNTELRKSIETVSEAVGAIVGEEFHAKVERDFDALKTQEARATGQKQELS